MGAGNKNYGIINFLPQYGQNQMNYSRLTDYCINVSSATTYGIKFVECEKETYIINNKRYVVKENQFLLINKGQDFGCEIREKRTVHGFCLSLEEGLLQKVFYQMTRSEEVLIDNPHFIKEPQLDFHETVYCGSDMFNQFLVKNINRVRKEESSFIDCYGFYHEAAFQLLLSQRFTRSQIQKIKASKNSTKKEIFDRLNIAKGVMDGDISQKLDINYLARQSGLSESHFYRSFKEAFGISPHQYIMGKRMKRSADLLREKKYFITDIAYKVGFSDVCSFSKCFKKYFKISPNKLNFNSPATE